MTLSTTAELQTPLKTRTSKAEVGGRNYYLISVQPHFQRSQTDISRASNASSQVRKQKDRPVPDVYRPSDLLITELD